MNTPNWPNIPFPKAEQKDYVRDIHGERVNDPYFWMNAYFKKTEDSPAVLAHLEQENIYAEEMMADTKNLQDKLFVEMRSRIKEKDESVPTFINGYYYYTRTEEGKQYYKFCRKKASLDTPEEILLDVDEMAEGKAYFNAKGFSISPNNELLAFGVDEVSRRQYKIFIKDLKTGKIYDEGIQNTSGSSVWANDNQTIFYTENNTETLLSEKIKRHQLGTQASEDVCVYHEQDPTNYIGVYKSKNRDYILIYSSATTSSEERFIKASEPFSEFQVFQKRRKDVLYSVVPLEDRFLIMTNDQAENFKLMQCPLDKTTVEHWEEIIPHRSDVLLESVEEFKDFLVITERFNGLTRLVIQNRKTKEEKLVSFDDPTYVVYPSGNEEYNSQELRFVYNSMVTPPSVYDENMVTGERKLLKQQEVLGDFNKDLYTSERLFATAQDGTKIPISVVYKKDTPRNGNTPLLLYGYGSYGYSLDASFSTTRLSLLNRGFVFAIAHVRGGEEMGRAWYENGKLLKKKNTFNDFIDCAKFLIQENYTSPAHLYAEGGSAGGLLMGAIANQAPELWNGIIAQVPFVDVINTMLDETIPLTTNEYDEWGNPNNEEFYHYMKSYSPYENIKAQKYPNMLITTGLHDSQVQYFEPAKWAAKLRDFNQGESKILFKTEMDFGHGGASGRFDYLKETAFEFAFLFKLEGITK
ncbi:S9 family peptidase [Ornithobacterium rhinotracheale]|uniref:Proline-specific endopeptidase n=1 Tax=Ornithobacterium rhinotracheale (strain ATCC 51463 / DSM 15997 / CCUG 23171 / CIP 104009 / LMG 9086) TaxID=867902 RepID=I3ZXW9_ORNRL|nr:oligopeptidase B [Ornithobacterium rhinotracheale]AFL96553.1 protease II [Ornithobacterium rhinotracheale DSM 15997]AIP98740.1 protease [Ornithobacterium rhinotracheale ORT-UMN 88]KGB67713.1 protease [Ornithobacterium rhinotracheale H06-030791]MCK0194877.1 oligopeptidase B [Ornithobacterium rhinotracheale]UOH62881.1 oligopeptidase B [Ornithobacterium rhinotracheale]